MSIKSASATATPRAGARAQGGALSTLVADAFAGFAGSAGHPCLGARSVVHRKAYTLRVYQRLGGAADASALQRDLAVFAAGVQPGALSSFVAVFQGPCALTETRFSTLLWRQLQLLHDIDRLHHAWDGTVSADPDDPHFSFSVAGTAFFVIGLHAGSSRWARRFAWPALVFNPHQQFVAMRERGTYERTRSMIRRRDLVLQGSVNEILRDHGNSSEALQYAGHSPPSAWRCPLVVRAAG